MSKVHYDKYGMKIAFCGFERPELLTKKRADVTCERCKAGLYIPFKELPKWIVLRSLSWLTKGRDEARYQERLRGINRDALGAYRVEDGNNVYIYADPNGPRVPCTGCGALILPATAERYFTRCGRCR